MTRKKIPTTICRDLSFSECERVILRMAVEKAKNIIGKETVSSKKVQKMVQIVEEYIVANELVCYGGTAVNNILPKTHRFYNYNIELPDYDVFSDDALSDAKRLADVFAKNGFYEVEARAGQHYGTYKVYADFIAVADITQMPDQILERIKQDAIRVKNMLYAPANFLRMSMYLELSRPAGDLSRWEKVQERLSLLNKNYPIANKADCASVVFQRKMEDESDIDEAQLFSVMKSALVKQDVVFFGGFANTLYSKYMPKKTAKRVQEIADFDVLSLHPKETATEVVHALQEVVDVPVTMRKHDPVGEIVPLHYEVLVGEDTVMFAYDTLGCHSYNVIKHDKQSIKVATIDTMLSFYLAFLYTGLPHLDAFTKRILCMSKFLFDVQQENLLSQRGLLKRFSITCYGKQQTLIDMKSEKSEKYKQLKKHPNRNEHERWFLNYRPKINGKKIVADTTATLTYPQNMPSRTANNEERTPGRPPSPSYSPPPLSSPKKSVASHRSVKSNNSHVRRDTQNRSQERNKLKPHQNQNQTRNKNRNRNRNRNNKRSNKNDPIDFFGTRKKYKGPYG